MNGHLVYQWIGQNRIKTFGRYAAEYHSNGFVRIYTMDGCVCPYWWWSEKLSDRGILFRMTFEQEGKDDIILFQETVDYGLDISHLFSYGIKDVIHAH